MIIKVQQFVRFLAEWDIKRLFCIDVDNSKDLKRYVHCWSKLPQDLMQMVFERLGFADFQRAKSVCSSWLSASRQSKPTNKIPWMILFPKDNNYGLLFNPEEKDKFYKTQDLGNDFAKSFCVATCRSWLLMLDPKYLNFFEAKTQDPLYNLYILDLLTRERINLPTLVSEFGLNAPIFWMDEKTKDYLVMGMFNEEDAVSFKKGDTSWKQMPELSLSCMEQGFNMVYKDHKLYCLNYYKLKIFDFSGEIPVKVFKTSVHGFIQRLLICPGRMPPAYSLTRMKHYVVVTLSGDVLIVTSTRPCMSKIWNFEIFKMDSSKGNKWEGIDSLGDEAILLELGITVDTKEINEGVKRNSIYFNGRDFGDEYDENDVLIFSLDTKKVEKPHQFVCSSVRCSNARWFLPSFKRE
ncbi:unnamed protein product [Microthlaspi erraticum]|uniref:F-box domain-containing protein n=1 Tax=Microthlaspi erraticum TaxID=1685480 RepID=A0A6D2LDJ3_9BRAS|nr:unnamed protein product [Microthlaspi erraticum]